MSTNPNTQQTNVFNKGMNTDTSDAFLGNEQYRYAENVRFFTNTGENSGELRAIEGALLMSNKNTPCWYSSDKQAHTMLAKGDKIVSVASIRHLLVVLLNRTITVHEQEKQYARIHVYDFHNTDGNSQYNPYVAFSDSTDAWSTDIKYSTVLRWENEKLIKLYIAGDDRGLMSLNISPYAEVDIFNYPKYTKFSQLIGIGKGANLNKIQWAESDKAGNINCPVIQYCYYLYNNNGIWSDLSPVTPIIRFYKNNKGYNKQQNTGKAIDLEIPVLSNKNIYSNICIFRIEYVDNGQSPSVYIIYDEAIGDNYTISYTDSGGGTLYSFAEFLSTIHYRIKPKLIESKYDYLFAANVKDDSTDVNKLFDNVKVSFSFGSVTYNINSLGQLYENSQNYGPTFMAGETYRYGFIYYLNDGTKTSVLNITDITIPTYNICQINGVDSYQFNRYYITFIFENLPNECIAYEAVRCNRTPEDSITLSQGIIGATFAPKQTNVRYASTLMTLQNMTAFEPVLINNYGSWSLDTFLEQNKIPTKTDIVVFASPESSYQMDDLISVMDQYENSLQIQEVARYIPYAVMPEVTYGVRRYNAADEYSDHPGQGFLEMSNWGHISSADNTGAEIIYPISFDPYKTDDKGTASNIWFFATYDFPGSGIYMPYKYDDLTVPKDISVYCGRYTHSIDKDGFSVAEDQNRRICLNRILIESQVFIPQSAVTGSIMGFKQAYSPDGLSFSNGDIIQVENDEVVVNTKSYINWDIFPLFKKQQQQVLDTTNTDNIKNTERCISSGKKGVVINTNIESIGVDNITVNKITTGLYDDEYGFKINGIAPISVVNIKKTSAIPYGGKTKQAYKTNTFYSFGDFSIKPSDSDQSNVLNVYGGDVYNCMFIYNSAHAWLSDVYNKAQMHPTIYAVPIQSRIDLMARTGDLYPDVVDTTQSYYFQDISGNYGDFYQPNDAYVYNTAYNVNQTAVSSTTNIALDGDTELYDTRIFYSEQKQNGELLDNWTSFKPLNFLDVDSRFGEITNLKLFKDSLIFQQENATGALSVNERVMLQSVDDTNIILGTGGVLQRFDYITTEYGMQPNQLCCAQSDSTLYWWDVYRKEIVAYSGGQQVLPMKITKQISNFINERIPSEHPVLAYDTKYKELLACVVDDNPIVYSEIAQYFTALYETPFKYSTTINGQLLLFNDTQGFEWNKGEYDLTPYIKYIVNKDSSYVKTFDNVSFGLGDSFYSFYNGIGELDIYKYDDETGEKIKTDGKVNGSQQLKFKFNTPGGQTSEMNPVVTDREYDFRFAIPRDQNATNKPNIWGGRMRGKTMQCEVKAKNNFEKFSLQYIITKYRISWS